LFGSFQTSQTVIPWDAYRCAAARANVAKSSGSLGGVWSVVPAGRAQAGV
jgi:hypothetical protein